MPDNIFHRRQSIRLPGYDYTRTGMYFVTICAQNKKLFFIDNQIKQMIEKTWRELKNKFVGVDLDQYVIMPNHLHGIVILKPFSPPVGADLRVCPHPSGIINKKYKL